MLFLLVSAVSLTEESAEPSKCEVVGVKTRAREATGFKGPEARHLRCYLFRGHCIVEHPLTMFRPDIHMRSSTNTSGQLGTVPSEVQAGSLITDN